MLPEVVAARASRKWHGEDCRCGWARNREVQRHGLGEVVRDRLAGTG